MMRIVFFVLLALAAVFVAWTARLKKSLRIIRQAMEPEVAERFDPEDVLLSELDALFLGWASAGSGQPKDSGALVLARDRLWFMRFASHNEFEIPLASIRTAEIRKTHLDRSCLVPLFYVEYEAEEGADSVAWGVRMAEEWVQKLEEARQGE